MHDMSLVNAQPTISLVHYEKCPSCGSAGLRSVLKVTDYTVSREQFVILECEECSLRFTQDIPDAGSIGPYYSSDAYISHSDTNKGLINRLYHLVRRHTLSTKRRLISGAARRKEGRLLDIGAGTGAFAAHMKENGWETTGLEPDEAARGRALSLHGLKLRPIEDLYSLPAEHFDVITLWHVLEHVHDLHRYLDQLKSLLTRQGCIFIAVPNYTSYDAGFYKEHWAAYDVPRHLYHFSPQSMLQLIEAHGMQLLGFRPMWYDSFYISMVSEQYRTGKGSIIRASWVGLLSNVKAFIDKSKCSSLIYVIGK